MHHLVQRMLFSTNCSQLDELDDEPPANRTNCNSPDSFPDVLGDGDVIVSTGALQDQGQETAEFSDLKSFVFECFSLVRRITKLPGCAQLLLTAMLPTVQTSCQQFMQIHKNPIPLVRTREDQAVHDLTVRCALLSCVSAQHFSNSCVVSEKTTGWEILVLFIQLAEYIKYVVFYSIQSHFDKCEVLSCIRLCTSCVPFVFQSGGSESLKSAGESIVQVILSTMDTSIVPSPQNVMQSALNLLACIGSVFPYSIQSEIPSMQQLQISLQRFSLHLPPIVQGNLYTALSHSVLSGDWNHASTAYAALITPVLGSLVESVITMQQNSHRVVESSLLAQLIRDVSICRALTNAVFSKPKPIKVAFYCHIQPALPYTLDVLRLYLTYLYQSPSSQLQSAVAAINELIGLYTDLFRSIRKELPSDIVVQIVTALVELFQHTQLTLKLESLGASGTAVLCGFLKLLRVLVEENTTTTASFLQSILDLCFGSLNEVIFAHRHYDTVVPFFIALMEEILENHYRFFVVTQNKFDEQGRRQKVFANEVASKYFLAILQAIGTILQQENVPPTLCKQIIVSLERIQASHNVFGFDGFRSDVRMAFLHTILSLLANGRVYLLKDELSLLLYHIAEVDFPSFYQVCLPQYVGEKNLLALRSWSGQTDEPTFILELSNFFNDLRVIQNCQ
ncbi:Aste57867_22555 [Aphanomyces stellatus]|uniref:Aste57867_22555 protein n=1 Tax=Aphanomyces stellatus TaxID=120398 RepID=A0A485LKE9_9STRA|nr:hypothetical protein As57867_022485 [Aphanomyces stellatus]VFT99214.1 Aste57867_22555 [Aphanomyces stellatus]